MSIQTAGEQKYYDFIGDRAKRLRTGMIVWGSLLAVAFIGMFSDARLGAVLALVGIALAVSNIKSQQALRRKLDAIDDKEEFFRQLTAPDLFELPAYHLIITKDYLLLKKEDIFIYSFSDIKKAEVILKGNTGKTLLLTDKQGSHHEIISYTKKERTPEAFDKAYQILRERIQS